MLIRGMTLSNRNGQPDLYRQLTSLLFHCVSELKPLPEINMISSVVHDVKLEMKKIQETLQVTFILKFLGDSATANLCFALFNRILVVAKDLGFIDLPVIRNLFVIV